MFKFMKSRTNSFSKVIIALLAMLPLVPGAAHAETVSDMINRLVGQAPAVVTGITVIAYVAGAIFGYIFIMNMRKYTEDPRAVNGGIKSLAITLLAAIFLLWFPSTIEIGSDTVMGGGAQSQGISGQDTLTR